MVNKPLIRPYFQGRYMSETLSGVCQGGELAARGADSWHLPIGLPGGHGIMEGVRVDESAEGCEL